MKNLVALVVLSVGLMSCAPQVDYNVPGKVGPQGPRGDSGPAGGNCTVTRNAGEAIITCPDGTTTTISDGTDGTNGQNCTVVSMANGATISCPDGTSTVILNGTNGVDGLPAPATAYSVTEVIDPCGPQAAFDEVLLKLANGQIMAHFASGANQFLSLIGPGSYVTTDNSACHFQVTPSMEVVW